MYELIRVLDRLICPTNLLKKENWYRAWIWILTFFIYTTYHMARKPISVVKNDLNENCTIAFPNVTTNASDPYWCDWAPFNTDNSQTLLGALDSAYLFGYAFGMFFLSGVIAERVNLNYFLSLGMILSGFFTAAFGLGYVFKIHSFVYYLFVQICGGVVLSSGWPGVVTVMGNWYGKSKRGLIMGVWNAHTSVGNIVGTLIASAFLDTGWGMSFIVPGAVIASLGVFVFFFLIPKPSIVGYRNPNEMGSDQSRGSSTEEESSRLLDDSIDDENDGAFDFEVKMSTEVEIKEEDKPISLWGAIKIPGVFEYAFSLFFSKLVSYTFLFWLPHFIYDSSGSDADASSSANLSTFFDVGGIFGGILAGIANDMSGMPASVCAVLLILAVPIIFVYQAVADTIGSVGGIFLLMLVGLLVNGPYALITTAVSAELGTHPSLRGNARALSTVTSVIDGTGSFGAAIGPLIAGALTDEGNWSAVFYMLMLSDVFSLLFLMRIVIREMKTLKNRVCSRRLE